MGIDKSTPYLKVLSMIEEKITDRNFTLKMLRVGKFVSASSVERDEVAQGTDDIEFSISKASMNLRLLALKNEFNMLLVRGGSPILAK